MVQKTVNSIEAKDVIDFSSSYSCIFTVDFMLSVKRDEC